MIERIGIIGGGQLGRMLTPPAHELGFKVTVLEDDENCPAKQVGADLIKASRDDEASLLRLAKASDVVTNELDHVNARYLIELKDNGYNIQCDPTTISIIQDKLTQSKFLANLGIPVAPFSDKLDESKFIGGGPFVVKTRRGGFDGRGNLTIDSFDDPRLQEFIVEKGGEDKLYVEQRIPFEKELAVVAARDMNGNIVVYPVVETYHENEICHTVTSPAQVDKTIHAKAEELAREVLKHLKGAGVFAIEMFLVNGELVVNEIAPRVHNSGHLTIEASKTSQFEQHVRAVTGLPLGSTEQTVPVAVMVNILGTKTGPLDRTGLDLAAALPNTKVHFYAKTPRELRKIGHVVSWADAYAEARETATQARGYFENL